LNKDEFAQVVRNTQLVSIDLIIRDPDQCVLVGLRTNEPAKGKWFVPGGVVRKYEQLADAFARIVKAEIGLEASIGDAKFIGVFEHLYDSNVFGNDDWHALRGPGASTQPSSPTADCERSAAQRAAIYTRVCDNPGPGHCSIKAASTARPRIAAQIQRTTDFRLAFTASYSEFDAQPRFWRAVDFSILARLRQSPSFRGSKAVSQSDTNK
jgi:colanic acid biosynthesis protein WcaH